MRALRGIPGIANVIAVETAIMSQADQITMQTERAIAISFLKCTDLTWSPGLLTYQSHLLTLAAILAKPLCFNAYDLVPIKLYTSHTTDTQRLTDRDKLPFPDFRRVCPLGTPMSCISLF